MKATAEQERALSASARQLVVVAAAGSGKTHILVQRYLRALNANPSWRLPSLVAITFTRAAAQEMRERVQNYLEQQFKDAQTAAEKKRWSERLAELPGARIQTIHALCADILRANAAVIGIDPGFSILDEAQAGALLDKAIDAVLAGKVESAADYQALFIEHDERDIRAILQRETDPLLPLADADALFAGWQAEWEAAAARLLGEFFAAQVDMPILIPENDLLGDRCKSLQDEWMRGAIAESVAEQRVALLNITSISLRNAGSASNWGGVEAKQAALSQLKSLVLQAREVLKAVGEPPADMDRQAAEDLQCWQALISRVQKRFRAAKEQQNALDYDDLEILCANLLQDAGAQARYQQEFRLLLVDEFQDTNARQWQIIQSLAMGEDGSSLFLVGDPRQSIYAFRGADVRVFQQVRQRKGAGVEEIPLSTSFRSNGVLLAAINDLFGGLLKRETDAAEQYEVDFGEPLRAHRQQPPSNEPVIELLCVNQSNLPEDISISTREAARQREAQLLGQRIGELIDSHTLIHDKTLDASRELEYGDIAVLFRSFNDIEIYEEAFARLRIPYHTHAGRGFYERQEIWDLLNLLSAIHDPEDELALASVLRSPLANLSDDALYALRRDYDVDAGRPRPLWQAVQRALDGESHALAAQDEQSLHSFAALFAELRALAGRLNVAELLQRALDRSGFFAAMGAGANGAQIRGNLEKLVDIAHELGHIQLSDFRAHIGNLRLREARESLSAQDNQSAGAVNFYTMHSSKGLEFPVIALADLSRGRPSVRRVLYQRDDERAPACLVRNDDAANSFPYAYRRLREKMRRKFAAEDKRLLYVAATRARDRLLLSGTVKESSTGEWRKSNLNWQTILEWLGISDADSVPTDQAIIRHYPWGAARIFLANSAPRAAAMRTTPIDSRAETTVVGKAMPTTGKIPTPALLMDYQPERPQGLRHRSASKPVSGGNETLVSAFDEEESESGWQFDEQTEAADASWQRRQLGLLLHAFLVSHQSLPESGSAMKGALADCAWRLGIADWQSESELISTAARIMETYRHSALYRELQSIPAADIHRELPYIHRAEHSVIHGRIDLLYRQQSCVWAVLDYKSNVVPGAAEDDSILEQHILKFASQLAAYTAALRPSFGNDLQVFAHYLRYGKTVPLPESALQAALRKLDLAAG